MDTNEQLDAWVDGRSIHNKERDECCPDFSCCCKEVNSPIEERLLFRDRPELRDKMLMMFLGRAIATISDKKVHIAGDVEGEG